MNPRNPNNSPAVNPDDPKWTAYVLGEVSDAERREIEQLLETSEDARALVEELTLATETLKEELVPDTTLMMSAAQRAAIRSAAEPKPRRWFEMFPSKWGLGLAAAALIVFAVVLPVAWRNEYKSVVQEAPLLDKVAERIENPAPVSNDSDRAKEAAVASESRREAEGQVKADEPAQSQLVAAALKKEAAAETRQQPAEADKFKETPPIGAVAAPVMTMQQFAANVQGAAPAAPAVTVTAGNGSLSGTVADSSSALIPGVRITATNTARFRALAMPAKEM